MATSYWATLAAADEAVRNVVCTGGNPSRIALLDNFCWPRCDDPRVMGTLVRAAEACYDAAMAYAAPFVSGKDSLSNQFTTRDGRTITIPPTMLLTAMAMVDDVRRCVTMDAKSPRNKLLLVGETTGNLGGSHLMACGLAPDNADLRIPRLDLTTTARTARVVADLIAAGLVRSAHDCSEGGLLVAAAEMAFAGRVGLDLASLDSVLADPFAAAFAETPGRYLLEIDASDAGLQASTSSLAAADIPHSVIGTFAEHSRLTLDGDHDLTLDESLDELRDTWRRPLDW